MASPQTANGYARLANELLQAIYRFPFSGQELRVVVWVLRASYGWSRKQTPPTSVRVLAADILMSPSSVGWAIKGLCARGVLLRMDGGALRLNKNYDEWLVRGSGQLQLTSNTTVTRARAAAENAAAPAPKARGKKRPELEAFVPPSLEDVREYCVSRKSKVDPEKFWKHYDANGWTTGKADDRKQVSNWKSSVCYWERTAFAPATGVAIAGKLCPLCETNPLPYPNAIVCVKCGPRCRACNEQTADLKILTRRDKTKTAVCRKGCAPADTPLSHAGMPDAMKKLETERATARFVAEQNRRKGR